MLRCAAKRETYASLRQRQTADLAASCRYEREVWDLYGVFFKDHPDLCVPFLTIALYALSDMWPDVPPLQPPHPHRLRYVKRQRETVFAARCSHAAAIFSLHFYRLRRAPPPEGLPAHGTDLRFHLSPLRLRPSGFPKMSINSRFICRYRAILRYATTRSASGSSMSLSSSLKLSGTCVCAALAPSRLCPSTG